MSSFPLEKNDIRSILCYNSLEKRCALRIIAGNFKGRRLYPPNDHRIRPTTDKVKEALFSILTNHMEHAVVLDLFSGTGNLGLEALSRGAAKVYFCDQSRDSISLIKKNIQHCGAQENSVILAGSYQTVLGKITEKVDLVFLDPPYQKGFADLAIQAILRAALLSDHGLIAVEQGKEEPLRSYPGLERIRDRCYGTIRIIIYEKTEE